MAELCVAYQPDDQWIGKITVRIVSGPFAGEGEAWINTTDLSDFAEALLRYPMPHDLPAVISGGHGGSIDGSRKARTLVRVSVRPQGVRGKLTVCAELQTEVWNDDEDLDQAVVARFHTEYGLVARFAQSLENMAAGRVKEATLAGRS